MATTLEVVPAGPYFGFDLSELEEELERFKAARKLSHSNLVGAQVNSRGYQFGTRVDGSLEDWQTDLQVAFYYLDPARFPLAAPTNSGCVAFA